MTICANIRHIGRPGQSRTLAPACTRRTILYIRVEDYGPKPKSIKQLVLDKGTQSQRTTINLAKEESGVYRMTMEDTAVSNVTYSAGNLTITVAGWTR